MKTTNALALLGAALLAGLWSAPRVVAKPVDRPLVVAQADKKSDADAQKQKKPQPQNAKKPQQQPRKPDAAQAKPKPQAQPRATQAKPKAAPARPKAAQAEPKPAAKPQAQAQERQQKPNADRQNREERRSQQREERQEQRNERRGERREQKQEQQKPAAAQPKEQQKPSAAQQKQEQRKPSAVEQKQEQQKPAARQQKQEEQKPAAAQQKEERQRTPAAAQEKEQQKPAATQQQQQQKEQEQKPSAQQKQEPQKPAAAQQKQEQQQPPAAAQQRQQQQQGVSPASEAAAQQAIKPKSADEFILRKGERRQRGIDDVRRERRETREGNRIVIHEGDRRIVREDNRIIIRHREAERFAIGARNVDVRRRGGEITTIVERPNGMRIINVTDDDGRLIRRVRRDSRGREIVIIDNRYRGRRPDIFIDVRPPRFHGHRDRYIVEAWRVPPPRIYEVFTAPPIEPLEQRYTLAQVRYNVALREYMPRVDLEINFESGSWQITPDQIAELNEIAKGLNRAIDQNPDEVFLIEGYTDAVGSEEDNLSLSDRRAEAVAVALTQEFSVPPENLVTQGYGEEHLKVETEGPNRTNRRVSIRRITPLIDKVAAQ
jgi:outer membrane protein OmpA-like peptidoglycan-associated protein